MARVHGVREPLPNDGLTPCLGHCHRHAPVQNSPTGQPVVHERYHCGDYEVVSPARKEAKPQCKSCRHFGLAKNAQLRLRYRPNYTVWGGEWEETEWDGEKCLEIRWKPR